MKRITLLLSVFLWVFAATGQSFEMDPQDYEKLLQIRHAEDNAKEIVMSMDRAPLSNHQIQPGQTQLGFRDGHMGYAWNIFAGTSGILEGPISLNLETGAATSIQEVSSDVIWMAAGEVADDIWYAVNYDAANGSLYTVDPATGDYTLVGATGYSLTGLAYDHNSGTMYASGSDGTNSQLYTVDLNTGAATLVGQISTGIIIGIAADADGNMYGINLDDNLYSIDPNTGAGTVIGPLGVTINYAQDIAFDRDNGVLYGALYTETGGLYTIDVTTGTATLINNFVAEVAGFGIPYTTAEDAAPAAVADFTATAGAEGALEVTLAWTNPSTQFDGGALTELTSVIIERDGVIIETIASPVIGEAATFVDNDITEAGTYTYRVYGVNSVGEGPKVAASLYVGEDVPAAPGDVTLVADGNDGHITWTAPTEGLNGGYISGTDLTYTVVRMPGAVEVATDITALEFLDTSVPGIGNYYYVVTASNTIGEGGFASSNVELLSAEGILLYETFDYETGALPPGWVVEGLGEANWTVFNGSNAGGTAPELRLTWTPAFDGDSRIISNPINVEGESELRFKFNMYLNNYSTNEGEMAAIDVSFDDGTTWEAIWEVEITENVGPDQFELYLDVPPAKSEMHLSFRFQGNVYNINQWYFDNLILEPVLENDLTALAITGNTTPSEGVENMYTVTIQNAGTLTQSDYTVKLMQEGDVEIASVAGDPIAFAETLTYEMAWTPTETGATQLYGVIEFAADEMPGNNQTPNLDIVVQAGDISVVTIGTGTNYPNVRMPFDFFWRNSLIQSIYYPDEIGMGGGVITGVQYTNNFTTDLPDREIRIWLGETVQEDLADGFIDPATLQLVYEGTVDFPDGENTIFIPFQDIYIYTGGNLVIYTQRVWEQEYHSSNDRFYGTEDPGSNRTRRRAADGTEGLDPMNPEGGAASDWHPNTALYFSTAGLGALEGTVTDGTNPVEGVLVSVLGTMATTHTDADGNYEFPYLLPETYNIEFSKFGYETNVIEGVVVLEEETTVQDAVMNAIPQFTVSGIVEGNDGILQEGAMISLEGYDDYMIMTEADGSFEIADVFEGTYTLTVAAEGYEVYVDEAVVVDGADLDLGTIIVTEVIVDPANLQVDVDGQAEGNALLTWSDVSEREFRYDDGTATGQLGSTGGTLNTVLGSAHRNDAVLTEMSWYLTAEGGPHSTVTVWVFGLDENGQPNPQDVLYEMAGVPNTDEQWNTYEFTTPVEAPNGFLIGLSYAGFLAIGTDAGTSTEWPFMPNSNFFVSDYSSGEFAAIEGLGDFSVNFLIRAFGVDNGAIDFGKEYVADNTTTSDLSYSKLNEPVVTGFPVYNNHNSVAGKAFTGFNVFLNGDEVASEITEMEYLFEGLDEGTYTAGVQSVYTTGESPIITVDFDMVFGVPATFTVTTNSGDSPEGAHVLLTNQDHEQYVYEHTVGADGVAYFETVRKGMYTLHITHDLFHDYIVEDIDIQDEFAYTAEMEEIINAPYGLMVETEGLPAGDAHFSWNNTTGWSESFEGGELPEGWDQVITNTGSQAGFLSTWHITGTVDLTDPIAPQDGDYQAFMMWSYDHQDEWLITPEFTAPMGDLVFWYYGTNGSPNADNYYVKASVDGGDTWEILWNASDLPEEENAYAIPAVIDLSDYAGQDIHIAWNNVDGPTNDGMWFAWAIDNISVGGEKIDVRDLMVVSNPKEGHNDAARDGQFRKPVTIDGMNYNFADKAFVGYNVFLNGDEVASEVADTEHMFTGLPGGTHTAGVQSVYTSGVSEIMTVEFTVEGSTVFPVTFTVNDLTETYQDIHIKGQMTDPEWEDVPMVEGPDYVWTLTMDVAPGTYEWGITESGDEWLLPEGDNLEFTVDAEGNITGVVSYDLPLNVQDFMNNNISMFPNPSNEVVTLRSGVNMSEIRVMDMSGRVVYTSNVEADEHQINVRSFESGIYFIQIVTAEGIFTGKLQVQK